MPKCAMFLALLLAGVSAIAAGSSSSPAGQSAKDAMPASKQAVGVQRKPVERKVGEAPKSSRDTPKPPLPLPEEKNLGLGCAQG